MILNLCKDRIQNIQFHQHSSMESIQFPRMCGYTFYMEADHTLLLRQTVGGVRVHLDHKADDAVEVKTEMCV